jgi:anthranilate/para-aminobenzoate synthase component I
MKLEPSFEAFEAAWSQGKNQVVYARLAADLDTPVSLMLKLAEARTDTFMLESVTGGEVRGRYSVVGMKPDLIWKCHGEAAAINREARFDSQAFQPVQGHPLDTLRALIAESRIDLPEGLPAIAAGLFGYLGYDMIRLVEHLPDVNPDPLGLPDAVLMRPSVVAVLDGVKGEVTLVAPPPPAIWARRQSWARCGRTSPMTAIRRRWKRPRITSARATSFRWSLPNAGRSGSNCRPLRCIAACAAPTPAPSCSSSTSAVFR